MNNSAKQYHASVDLLQLFTVTLFCQSVSISLSVSSEFSFISVSSVKVVVSLTHAFGSSRGMSESCVALAWSSDGMIIVALVLCIQGDSSYVFPSILQSISWKTLTVDSTKTQLCSSMFVSALLIVRRWRETSDKLQQPGVNTYQWQILNNIKLKSRKYNTEISNRKGEKKLCKISTTMK